MIGCYDFCGHYEWTFQWLAEQAGEETVQAFWEEAIGRDSQAHARELFLTAGLEGMRSYWAHTLEEEGAGYTFSSAPHGARIDMHDCPSKGFLLRNNLRQYHDYCDHCIGWIGPVMKEAGFLVDHEHNHCGQCWWEFRPVDGPSSGAGGPVSKRDVRLEPDWRVSPEPIDVFRRASSARQKQPPSTEEPA